MTVNAKSEYPEHSPNELPLINLSESVEPISFQAFEISAAHYRPVGVPAVKPRVSQEVRSTGQATIIRGFQPGQGLGKNSQGIKSMIQTPTQLGKAGLGFFGSSAHRDAKNILHASQNYRQTIHLSESLTPISGTSWSLDMDLGPLGVLKIDLKHIK